MADFLMEPQITTSSYSKHGQLVSVSTGSKKTIEKTTYFDRYKSPIRVLNYRDNKLSNEFRNEYKYDKYHNWTSNRVSIKEHFTDRNDFIPIYEEKRDIAYY